MSIPTSCTGLFLTSAILISGCGGDIDEWNVGSAQESLFLTGDKWEDGVVPVCWSAASQARSDFATLSPQVRDIVDSSWPAVADVEFTGWGGCPSSTNGMVLVNLNSSTQANATIGFKGNVTHTVNLGVNRGDFFGGLVPHEFGHILGFAHEMARSDFDDDSSGGCQQDNDGGDTLGTPADRQSIMASTGYCQSNPLLSRWDLVGSRNAYGTRADNVIPAGSTLYARKRATGDIYRRSGASWVRIGSPGGQFVAVGSTLYGLSADNSEVHRYSGSGTTWTLIGSAAKELLRCGASLCAVSEDDGSLQRYNGSGTSWTQIGGQAAVYASTSTKIYRLNLNRTAIQEYSGTGTTWTQVGGAASFLFATTTSVFATDPLTRQISRYAGSGSWTIVGGPGRTWVGVGSTLYGLSTTRGAVRRYTGNGIDWTDVGGAADWIYGGQSGSLYATNPSTKDIWQYNGSSWTSVGQP